MHTNHLNKFIPAGIFAALCLFGTAASAKVVLPKLFGDNMVFQQKTTAAIWGKAVPGKKVTVAVDWQKGLLQTAADDKGNWKIKIPTPAYGGPYQVKISDGEELVLKNVMVGEVWLCSGQSNMEMPLEGWGKIQDYKKEIAAAVYPQIRLLQLKHVTASQPLDDITVTGDGWAACSPASVAEFSSVAYFFAREIYNKTKIPVGLIHSSWGGTIAEAWTSGKTLASYADFAAEAAAIAKTANESPAQFQQRLEDWNQSVRLKDKGCTNGVYNWNSNSTVLNDWKDMETGKYWEEVLPDFDGVIWFRKSVMIPKEWLGKAVQLNLGPVDDDDITWVNGQKVGETQGYNVNRSYTIPANLLKEGENIITVRVFDGAGGGGIYGQPALKLLNAQQQEISIAGAWKYKIGVSLTELGKMPQNQDSPNRPTVLYNAMIHPLIGFPIKGAIWYQGESNADRAHQYRTLFPTLIRDWRTRWGIGDFPFYYVQLANYMRAEKEPVNSAWAELRDAQLATMSLPNTGMAVTIDIGDANDIHPKNKQDVGYRLAEIALAKNYKQKNSYSGPQFAAQKIDGKQIILQFNFAGQGLSTRGDQPLSGFAIAGADQQYHWAEAKIVGNTVVLTAPGVDQPLTVRYGWANNPDCNLYNKDGFPASPFRTDTFADTTERK